MPDKYQHFVIIWVAQWYTNPRGLFFFVQTEIQDLYDSVHSSAVVETDFRMSGGTTTQSRTNFSEILIARSVICGHSS